MNEPRSTRATEWHASEALLLEYTELRLDVARAASLEQHLLACASCRSSLASLSTDGAAGTIERDQLDRLWLDIIDEVDRPRLGRVASLLVRLGLSERTMRVVAAAPALRLPWLGSVVGALAFAVLAARQPNGSDGVLLALAPLLPLVGIGLAYGSGVDPLHELARSAPMPQSRIFLYRSAAVLITALPLTLVASLVLRFDGLEAMSWLLPALGLVGATMALSTWVQPRVAAMATGGAWIGVLVVAWVRSARLDGSRLSTIFVFAPTGQLVFAVMAVAGAAVFFLRPGHLDQPDHVRLEGR
jgi:hypothetical protein